MPPLWTIVLAAGAGRRLASLTGGVPKQFWSGAGGRSLLEETLTRLGPLWETSHRVVITDQAHRPMLEPLAASFGTAVFQPSDRGTATGVLLSLAPVLAADPDSIVVVTPCDHGVAERELFGLVR